MAFKRTIEVTELANDDFEMFVDSIQTISNIQNARAQNQPKKISNKLTSIKVYEIRRLPKCGKSSKYYKKEIEIPVNYSDSEEDIDTIEPAGSLIRTSSIRQAYRKKSGEKIAQGNHLSKPKGIKLKRGKGFRLNKDGYAYRMWKNLVNLGKRGD